MALERGAAHQLLDVAGLAAAVALYFDQPELRRAAGRAAHTLVTDNRGALARDARHRRRARRRKRRPFLVSWRSAGGSPVLPVSR